MTREERENAIRCLKIWIEREPYIQTYKTCLEALEQSMPTMVYPQVDGITPTVVAQADGEKTCGTCRNEDTYHCAECENKSDYEQSQADGEYILKKDVMGCIGQTSLHWELARKLRGLPSVAIPPAEPREVLYSGDGYADGEMVYDMAECMNCGREFEYDDETWGCNFCPDCGQALKWEGEQE